MEIAKIVRQNKNYCHDCKKEIKIEEGEIKNGFLLAYNDDGKRLQVFKCSECFRNNPGLNNFRQCEVYSRPCGYLRPIQQWNIGKQREFGERKYYSVK
ncbi:MAG: anaerobic ribonucleoside-triphosphate reductase [Patescibacteria group bacterium]